MTDLDRARDQILSITGQQSATLQDLRHMEERNEDLTLDVRSRLGEAESADLAQVIVDMQSIETALQFNYASLSIIRSANLLDFLG